MGRPHNAVGAGVFGDAALARRTRQLLVARERGESAFDASEEAHVVP